MDNYLRLNNGFEIPPIGLGTYRGTGLVEIIQLCIALGYRLIDTAYIYQNENEIGEGLNKVFEKGDVKREDLFIVSKLWNTKHRPQDVIPSIQKSLSNLQLEYLDLYLIHWPMASKPSSNNENQMYDLEEDKDVSIEETWLAMEECVKKGYAKSIGLSNFNSVQIERILKVATIKPVVNEVECNPYVNQKKMIAFCKERDIQIIGFSPFCGVGKYNGNDHGPDMFEEPVLKELSEKYEKPIGQIILRYMVQRGVIPIPKSSNPERLKQNIDIFDFSISDEDVAKIDSLNNNKRCSLMQSAQNHTEYPFHIEF